MAEELSVQTRTELRYLNIRPQLLSSGPKKIVARFSSIVKHYLERCLATNFCAQFLQDIATSKKFSDKMTPTLRKVSLSLK